MHSAAWNICNLHAHLLLHIIHGLRTPNESFFLDIPNDFRVFLVLLSVQILSLCIPSLPDFALLSQKRFHILVRIGIWFSAVEKLVPSHLVSVVRA